MKQGKLFPVYSLSNLDIDDGGLPKKYAQQIEAVRPQWSGSNKKVVQGIGIVTCVSLNSKTHEFFLIDYRLFDKDHDGKTKINHPLDMLHNAYFKKQIPNEKSLTSN